MPEYYDYQRKIEYNREKVFGLAEKFTGRVFDDFGMMSDNDMKEILWARVPVEEYETPPKDWKPKDPKLKFEWEI